MRIALAGNPNSGKTTMFNALTGKNEKVGNWAGVTVDKAEYPVKRAYTEGRAVSAVDLPGAYSMSPFTSEESITSAYIKGEAPDVIVNVVDASNLSRSLFFTTQLLELGIPLVVALNKADVNDKRGTHIDVSRLSERLGCPVVETVSVSGKGTRELMQAVFGALGKVSAPPYLAPQIDMTDKATVAKADKERFAFVNGVVAAVEKRNTEAKGKSFADKADEILTNKWLGIPIFAVVMFLVFQISQAWVGPAIADGFVLFGLEIPGLVTLIDAFGAWVGGLLAEAHPLLTAIIVDGIIGGVGAVVGFLPLVMVMYFLISLLEDCGYMARATVVLDPIFKRVGLSGKSVIPFVVGTGCAIPGVMACRTIRNERERRATAMLAPFMPCGAKLPVIALFAGAFFDGSAWVGTAMYFVAIFVILFGALLVNRLTGNKARKSFFIIELPDYKAPSFKRAALSMCQRGWSYIVKAGTIILVCNFAVQLMLSFNFRLEAVENASESILAVVASPFAYLFAPLVGVVAWQLAAAIITGFIAKENVVGTLAVCFVGLENLIDTEELAMLEGAGASVAGVLAISKVAALAFLMFNLFSPPCFAAIGAMNAEMKSAKWLFAGIGLQLSVGYALSFVVYFFGTLLTGASFGAPWMVLLGWGLLLGIAAVYALLILKKDRELKRERTSA